MKPDNKTRLLTVGLLALFTFFEVQLQCMAPEAPPQGGKLGAIITPPGIARVVTNSPGLLGGSGTTSNPLTATISTSGLASGTGSSGSAINVVIATSGSVSGTGSAGSPITDSAAPTSRNINTTAPLAGGGNLTADRTFSINTNGIDNTLIRQGVGVSIIGRSVNSTGNVADIVAAADNTVLSRLSGVVAFTDASSLAVAVSPFKDFGDGSDGAIHFDGTTTITLGANNDGATIVPSGGKYTLLRDIFATTVVIDSGVVVNGAGFFIFAKVSANGPGTFSCDGNNGVNGTTTTTAGGANTGTNRYNINGGGGGTGGVGAASGGVAGTGATNAPEKAAGLATGNGGAGNFPHGGGSGGNGGTGAGSQGGSVGTNGPGLPGFKNAPTLISRNNIAISNGGGGGGGAGVTGFAGGGGGSGGGIVGLFTPTVLGPLTMSAKGGNGGNGNAGGNTGGGGGGGGGWVVLDTMAGAANVTTNVSAGTGGTHNGTGHDGGNGAAGTVLSL